MGSLTRGKSTGWFRQQWGTFLSWVASKQRRGDLRRFGLHHGGDKEKKRREDKQKKKKGFCQKRTFSNKKGGKERGETVIG